MSIKTEALNHIRRFLTDDDILSFVTHKHEQAFRVRIWRGKEATTIVLVSQVKDGIKPCVMSTDVANHVFSSILGYPDFGMLYFEDSELPEGQRCLHQIYFEHIGVMLRRRLFKPIAKFREWEYLEHIVGEVIEK